MKNFIKLNIVLLVLTLKSIVFAQSIPEGMGFYDHQDATIPSLVQQASKSIFRLAVPSGNQVTVAKLFNGKSTEEAISFINGLDQSKISKTDKAIFLFQLHQCLKNSTQPCTVFEGVEQGTGFVVDDGSKIYTAYHVIKSVASNSILPIFIIGSSEEIIFSPIDIELTIIKVGNTNVPAGLNPNVEGKLQDIVSIKSSLKISEPLKPASKKIEAGSKVYMTGFPMPTKDRNKYGALDSDGLSKYTSIGHILTAEEIKIIALKKFGSITDGILSDLVNNLVISNADGAPGISGAPTLNENGEYVGIYTSGAPQYDAAVDRISYSSPIK